MFVVYEFYVSGMMIEWYRFEMSAQGRKIYCFPCPVGPSMLRLEVLAEVSAVDLKSEVGVNVAGIPYVVDHDGYFGGWNNVCCRRLWFETWSVVLLCRKFVNVYVQFCVW